MRRPGDHRWLCSAMQIGLVALAVCQWGIKSRQVDEEKYDREREQREELLQRYFIIVVSVAILVLLPRGGVVVSYIFMGCCERYCHG